MKVDADGKINGPDCDLIYIQSWQAVLSKCKTSLERNDHSEALEVQTIEQFTKKLGDLQIEYKYDEASMQVIAMLYPTLPHYSVFAASFVKMMEHKVETSMLWGLLFLVVKISLESQGTIERITRMLRAIGYKLHLLHKYTHTMIVTRELKEDAVEVNREIITLWLDIITLFRRRVIGTIDQLAWDALDEMFSNASKNIENVIDRAEKLSNLAKSQQHIEELVNFQKLLAMDTQRKKEIASLPCNNLPYSRNPRFYGRQELIARIEECLKPQEKEQDFTSLVLHGLGGIGKTQIALHYAYSKLESVDAVLWIPSENRTSLEQAFSHITTQGLEISKNEIQDHKKNRVVLLDWLQKTSSTWLVIFDNVESAETLTEFWPVSRRGSVLITTRRHALPVQAVDFNIEVPPFGPDEGAGLLLHHLPDRQFQNEDHEAAFKFAAKLGGHALAISQMAALIKSRAMSINELFKSYEKLPKRIHRHNKTEWKHSGYKYALDTVWKTSFEILDLGASSILSILCFLSPDSITEGLFESRKNVWPETLEFLDDDFSRGDALEILYDLALARKDSSTSRISLHRLVQVEFIYHIGSEKRQQAFELTASLLNNAFPQIPKGGKTSSQWSDCNLYMQHVISLVGHYRDQTSEVEKLHPTLDFCNLLVNYIWFLKDSGTQNEVKEMLETVHNAFKSCNQTTSLETQAWILTIDGMLQLDLGRYPSALSLLQEALAIRIRAHPRSRRTSGAYSNLALAYGSLCRWDEGLQCLQKAQQIFEGQDDETAQLWKIQTVHIRLNIAQICCQSGRYEESQGIVDDILREQIGTDRYLEISEAYQIAASIALRLPDLEKAEKIASLISSTVSELGDKAKTYTKARYLFIRGLIAVQLNKPFEAISLLKEALTYMQLYGSSLGVKARAKHVLSKALLGADLDAEAAIVREEAKRMKLLARMDASTAFDRDADERKEEENDEQYELLVKVQHRM